MSVRLGADDPRIYAHCRVSSCRCGGLNYRGSLPRPAFSNMLAACLRCHHDVANHGLPHDPGACECGACAHFQTDEAYIKRRSELCSGCDHPYAAHHLGEGDVFGSVVVNNLGLSSPTSTLPSATPQFSSDIPEIPLYLNRVSGLPDNAYTSAESRRVAVDARAASLHRRGATASASAISFARPGVSVLGPPSLRTGLNANNHQVHARVPNRLSPTSMFLVYIIPADLASRRSVKFQFLDHYGALLDLLDEAGLAFTFTTNFNVTAEKERSIRDGFEFGLHAYQSRFQSTTFPVGPAGSRIYQFYSVAKPKTANAAYRIKPVQNVEVPDLFINYTALSSSKILFGRPPNPKSIEAHTLFIGPAHGDLCGMIPKVVFDHCPDILRVHEQPHPCMGCRVMVAIIRRCDLPAQVASFPDRCRPDACPMAANTVPPSPRPSTIDEDMLLARTSHHSVGTPERPTRRVRLSDNSTRASPHRDNNNNRSQNEFYFDTSPFQTASSRRSATEQSYPRTILNLSAPPRRADSQAGTETPTAPSSVTFMEDTTVRDDEPVDTMTIDENLAEPTSPFTETELQDRIFVVSRFFDGLSSGHDQQVVSPDSGPVAAWQDGNFRYAERQEAIVDLPDVRPTLRIIARNVPLAATALIRAIEFSDKYGGDNMSSAILRKRDVPNVMDFRAFAVPWTFIPDNILLKPGSGIGVGAMRDVIDEAFAQLLLSPFWVDRAPWVVPNDPFGARTRSDYLRSMRMVGFLLAMRLHHLAGPPDKFHPLIFAALVLGSHTDILHDAERFCALHPLLAKLGDQIKQYPEDVTVPITVSRELVSDYMDKTLKEIRTDDPELRADYRKILTASFLLGVKYEPDRPHGDNTAGIKALALGFSNFGQPFPKQAIEQFITSYWPGPVLRVEDVISRIDIRFTKPGPQVIEFDQVYERTTILDWLAAPVLEVHFALALFDWLQAEGSAPLSIERAERLLQTVASTRTIPIGKRIKLVFEEAIDTEKWFRAQTCFETMIISPGPWVYKLYNAKRQCGSLPTVAPEFDSLFSGTNVYNTS